MAHPRRKLVAFFEINLRQVPIERVYDMLCDIGDKLGADRAGDVSFSTANRQGYYVLAFSTRDAADLFERLYRQTGHNPGRTPQPPRGWQAPSDAVEVGRLTVVGVAVLTDPRRAAAPLNWRQRRRAV